MKAFDQFKKLMKDKKTELMLLTFQFMSLMSKYFMFENLTIK